MVGTVVCVLVVVAAIAALGWCAFWARWWLPAVPAVVALAFAGTVAAGVLSGLVVVGVVIVGVAGERLAGRRPELTAVLGLLAGIALAGVREVGFVGGSALLAVAAALPVVVAGVVAASSSARRAMGWTSAAAAGALTIIVVVAGGAAITAATRAADGIDAARLGVDAVRAGDQPEALAQLRRGEGDLRAAGDRISSAWVAPARLLPVIGPHLDASAELSETGVAVVGAAADAAEAVDLDAIRPVEGRIDLAVVTAMADPMDTLVATMEAARTSFDDERSAWLIPRLERELDDLAAELDDQLVDARLARDGVTLLPGMLGADGERRYLMLFGTTSEAREAGGLLGNFVEVVARDGVLQLGVAGRNSDLNDYPGEGVLADPSEYPELFVAARPGVLSQDYTRIVDFPTMARAANELYSTMGGRPVDGVGYLDPAAIAAFLTLTGPLESPEIGRTFTAENVEDFLLREQYERFDEHSDRQDFLTELSVDAFDRLLEIELPAPSEIAEVFGPVVRQGHLVFTALDPDEAALIAEVGVDGSFPSAEGGDLLSVVHVNKGSDKLDAYTQRRTEYVAALTPLDGDSGPSGDGDVAAGSATGTDARRWEVDATVTIRFRNEVQPEGLPSYVVGPPWRQTAPSGVNLVEMSVYTPWDLVGVVIDGEPAEADTYDEFGAQRHVTTIGVGPGQERVFEYTLRGTWVGDPADYTLQLASQPLVHEAPFDAVVTAEDEILIRTLFFLDEDYQLLSGVHVRN